MRDPLEVRSTERGIVRVFTTALEPKGNAAITPENVQRLLGDGIELDGKKVEVFPASMIESMGMTTYLMEGHGIPEEALAGKAAVLNALTGLVILIPSSAFQGAAAMLDPNPALRFIGAFAEVKAAPPKQMAKTDAADGVLAPPGPSPRETAARRVRGWWLIALSALVLALTLALFFLF